MSTADFGKFVEHFSILPDPRVDRTKRHNLIDILFVGVCTVLCGGEGFTDMEDFSILDPAALVECFMRRRMKRAAWAGDYLAQVLVS